MAAVYVTGAAGAALLIVLACLAGGAGLLSALAAGYLGAVAAIGALVLARLRATGQPRRHGPGAGHEEAGLPRSFGPLA